MSELCPHCRELVIPIPHLTIGEDELTREYRCEKCHKTIRVVHIPFVNKDKEAVDETDNR